MAFNSNQILRQSNQYINLPRSPTNLIQAQQNQQIRGSYDQLQPYGSGHLRRSSSPSNRKTPSLLYGNLPGSQILQINQNPPVSQILNKIPPYNQPIHNLPPNQIQNLPTIQVQNLPQMQNIIHPAPQQFQHQQIYLKQNDFQIILEQELSKARYRIAELDKQLILIGPECSLWRNKYIEKDQELQNMIKQQLMSPSKRTDDSEEKHKRDKLKMMLDDRDKEVSTLIKINQQLQEKLLEVLSNNNQQHQSQHSNLQHQGQLSNLQHQGQNYNKRGD